MYRLSTGSSVFERSVRVEMVERVSVDAAQLAAI
jgi:hypothetical protein